MKCPRCKTEYKDPPVYCLTCGKQLRRDDAFDGEFEEEFLFDEEREATVIAEGEQLRIHRQKRRRAVIFAFAFSAVLAIAVVFCILLFFSAEDAAEPQILAETGSAEVNALNEDEIRSVQTAAEKLLRAANTDYDLDVILSYVYPDCRQAVLDTICRDYGCQSREELEKVFAQKHEGDRYECRDITVSVSAPVSETILASLRDELTGIFRLPDAERVKRAVFADVSCTVRHGTQEASQQITYLFCEIDGSFFVFDL